MNMLQHRPHGYYIKKIVRKCGLLECSVKHIDIEGGNCTLIKFNPICVKAECLHHMQKFSP